MSLNIDSLKSFYQDQVEFWEEERSQIAHGDYAYIELVCSEIRRLKDLQKRLDSVVEAYNAHGIGLELKSDTLNIWCMVLPDASAPGSYRYQVFNDTGFLSHHTRASLEDVLLDAFNDGFRVPDTGALERMAGKAEWRKGMLVNELVWEVNTGLLDMQQATQRYEDYLQKSA